MLNTIDEWGSNCFVLGWQQPAMMAPSGMYQATGNDAQSDPPPLAPSNAVNVTANEHQSPLRSEQENTV